MSLFTRFLTYQKERFPFIAHGVLISVFTFSAIAYSIISRGESEFISWKDFGICAVVNILFFFLVRVFDEFKDKEDDAKYRQDLPVPRGLISLKELAGLGIGAFILQLVLVVVFQRDLLVYYFIAWAFLLAMRYEFGIPKFLRGHQLMYNFSHMLLVPLIDMYASAIHWNQYPDFDYGIVWFLVVSYFNGLVLEFGRKLRSPEDEKEGVVTYTSLYGLKGGTLIFIGTLSLTFGLSIAASLYVNHAWGVYLALALTFLLGVFLALKFLKNPSTKGAKTMEYYAAIWSIGMYLSLGLGPFISL